MSAVTRLHKAAMRSTAAGEAPHLNIDQSKLNHLDDSYALLQRPTDPDALACCQVVCIPARSVFQQLISLQMG